MYPKVLVACPTWMGGAYNLAAWADAYKAFTYPHKGALMVDNSDENLHYTHLVRAQGIDCIYQWKRFPYLWDTLELSWRIIIEYAHEHNYTFILSLEHDILAPPNTIEILLGKTHGQEKPPVVSHRYHPRGQEGSDYWFDTLGCTLLPVEPLWEARNRIMAIFEMDCFIICQDAGHGRIRLKDSLDLRHVPNPDDSHKMVFGATPAPTRYSQRMQAQAEGKSASEEEKEWAAKRIHGLPAELKKVPIPMGKDATLERPPYQIPHGACLDEPYNGVRTDSDRAQSLQHMTPEEKVKTAKEETHVRLNIGCGMQQISGFLGVDFDPDVHPDVLAECGELPYADNTVDDIYASHVLEHVPMDYPALAEWLRVLKPGGMLTVAVPDIVQVYYLWKHGGRWGEYNQLIDENYVNATAFGANLLVGDIPEMKSVYGGPGHKHQQIFLFDMLVNRVVAAGFDNVHEVASCFLRPAALGETMVQGQKPAHEGA